MAPHRLTPKPFAAFAAASLLASFGCIDLTVAQQNSVSEEFNDIRNSLGLGKDTAPIDFHERPPLVVPPSYTLPPPSSADSDRMPVNDPDIAARRRSLLDPRQPVPPSDPGAGAAGRAGRSYLIDPPAGYRDPDVVAAGITHDSGPAAAAPSKRAHKHHKKQAASQ